MPIYDISIATSAATLAASSGTASPMTLPPQRVVIIPPDEHFTASGYRKLNGSEGRELYWTMADPADYDDIFDRTGGSAASSILGAIRCPDWISRSTTVQSYSIFTAFLDQPIRGEWRIGHIRYNLMVRVRRMTLYQELTV